MNTEEEQRIRKFMADLDQTYESIAKASYEQSPTDSDCLELENIFEKMRHYRDETLKKEVPKLKCNDQDHPVFMEIGLLGPLSLGLREIAHTSILSWFLNPKEKHGYKNLLLIAVLNYVSSNAFNVANLAGAKVEAERGFDLEGNKGRIDICAEGLRHHNNEQVPWSLWIEAKIDSGEGDRQLTRYAEEIYNWKRNNPAGESYALFLTRHGQRGKGDQTGDWITLNYEGLVDILWREGKSKVAVPGYQLLRYYLAGVLMDILEWPLPLKGKRGEPYAALGLMQKVSGV